MTTTADHRLLLTLPDVAALARVRRPVVSVWRSRSVGSPTPFPPAAVRHGPQELFALDDVVAWLETTGRGNNPHARSDAALAVALETIDPARRPRVIDGLTALLALKAVTGAALDGLEPPDVLDLADDADPHDTHLYGEVSALGEDLGYWARHADAAASAGYTPASALEAVVAQHRRLGLHRITETTFARPAVDLAARVVAELLGSGPTTSPVVDPVGSPDLLVAVREHLGEDAFSTVALPPGPLLGGSRTSGATPPAVTPGAAALRLARRRAAAHGWDLASAQLDDGRLVLPPGSLTLAQLPSATAPGVTDAEILTLVEDIALAMHDDDRAVILGPASALVDRSAVRDVTITRADVLRTGRVRAVVRLPVGLWPVRSRERLALWVLGPAHPDVRTEDRWVTVADLDGTTLDDAVAGDLVTDVVAALGDRATVRAHAFRFARLVPASSLVATSGDLVVAAAPSTGSVPASAAEVALRIERLTAELVPPEPLPQLDVEHHTAGRPTAVTLGDLVAAKSARVVPGNRLRPEDVTGIGGVRVIGPEEVLGEHTLGERTIDRLTFSAHYPSGRYTEPGDVVWCSTPDVGAIVDHEGLSVVMAPARVLRLDRAARPALLPDAVVRDLRAAVRARSWRSWAVRTVPPAQVRVLETVLGAVGRAREEAERRLAVLDDLAGTLVDGVTSGALTLNLAALKPSTSSDDHPAEQEG